MGRPSSFSEKLAGEIIDRIPSEPLTLILASDDMPGYSTVMRWCRENEAFRAKYAHAREDQGDYDADQIAVYTGQMLAGIITPEQCRVAIDALKWSAGKRRQKVYGDKVAIEHSGNVRTSREMPDAELERIAAGGSAGAAEPQASPFIVRDVL